jgi:PAS domain S-box-containing protein
MLSLAGTLALLSAIVLLATQIALRPLKRLTAVSDEISRGNLDCEIRPPARDDEVGRLNRSFLVMRDVLKKNRLLERRVQEDAADLASANERLSIENLERCWINQALEHQLRYDRLIVNSITDPVFVLTKTMNISRMNPAVVHLSGWEPHELVNSPLARVVRLDGGGHGSVASPADPLAQALGEGRDLRDQPAILEDRKGHSIPVRLTLFPLRDGNKVVGGVAVVTPAAVIRPSIQNTP